MNKDKSYGNLIFTCTKLHELRGYGHVKIYVEVIYLKKDKSYGNFKNSKNKKLTGWWQYAKKN